MDPDQFELEIKFGMTQSHKPGFALFNQQNFNYGIKKFKLAVYIYKYTFMIAVNLNMSVALNALLYQLERA